MDFLSTTEFRSKLFPEVKLTIRTVTVGRRMDFIRTQREVGDDLGRSVQALWNSLIKDFDGLTIDGVKPSVDDLFLDGPESLVDEISSELNRLLTPLGATDGADEAIIASARQQIAEAEARIAARKNSGPQSSTLIPDPDIRTAANAGAIPTTPAGSAETGTA